MSAASELFDRIVDKNLLVRRLNIVANHVLPEADAPKKNDGFVQLDLFTDYVALEAKQERERAELERERKMQQLRSKSSMRCRQNEVFFGKRRVRNFFSVIPEKCHGNIWSQARNTGRKQKTWHREQNLPVVVLRKANLFNRVVSAL